MNTVNASGPTYRVIALTAGTDETPCEAVFNDANAVLALAKVGQIFCGQLTPGTGFALYRPISGDGTLFGIAQTQGLTRAASDVLAERQRQIDVKGWTPEHDDEHVDGSLSVAALAFLDWIHGVYPEGFAPFSWPWNPSAFKPEDRRTALCKAAALLLAEIERLDRAELNGEVQS
jgi:hypothetical protein